MANYVMDRLFFRQSTLPAWRDSRLDCLRIPRGVGFLDIPPIGIWRLCSSLPRELDMLAPENVVFERLRIVAQQINEREQWKGFLAPHEYQFCLAALEHPNPESWTRFLAGKVALHLVIQNKESGKEVRELDAVTLAFRVRFMLWDPLLNRIADPNVPNSEPTADSDLILRLLSQVATRDGENMVSISQSTKHSSTESDYDDDYDDDEPEEEVAVPPLSVIVIKSTDVRHQIDAKSRYWAVKNHIQMYDTFELDEESDINEDDNDDLTKFYFETITPDLENNSSQAVPVLPGSHHHVSSSSRSPEASHNNTLRNLAKNAQFGSANLCLKNLLTTIEQKRQNLPVSDLELRNLLSDVRKNRSKWASEERVGQEELYEACEKVVLELRAIPESAQPFLNKVSKREAPNYYDIIGEPMDLSNVMRKLRALQYNSKQEFLRDLNLIWTNCLTYNSDPSHFLRKHAIVMSQKTEALAPFIPDIIIRSRAEVEAEAEIQERRLREQKRKRESQELIDKRQHTEKQGENTSFAEVSGANHTETVSKVLDEVGKSLRNDQNRSSQLHQHSLSPPSTGSEPSSPRSQFEDDEPPILDTSSISEPTPLHLPDIESILWQLATKTRREELRASRHSLFVGNTLQMDAPATLRTPAKMLRFEQTISEPSVGVAVPKTAAPPAPLADPSRVPGSDYRMGIEPFLLEYEVSSGVPCDIRSENPAWLTAPVPRAQDLAPSKYLARGALNDLVNQNLNEMQIIRRIISKIKYIRDLQTQPEIYAPTNPSAVPLNNLGKPEIFADITDPEEDISSRLPGATPVNGEAAYSSLRRTVAKLLMQSGFEAANPSAVDCVTDIAKDYLEKLGATLVANLEAPNSTASFSEVLNGSLQSMGINKPGQLTKYMADDVLRQGRRLALFRSRLNANLVDILRPEVERYQDEQFQENSEQFVFGQFSNELGDDYFGFKDLGLDKELSVASIAVPFHLLQQRVVGEAMGRNGTSAPGKTGTTFPRYAPLTPERIEGMPVLFKNAFKRILRVPLGLPVVRALEDTEISQLSHSGLPDAHIEVFAMMSEVNGKKTGETKLSRDVAKQISQKKEQETSEEAVAKEIDLICCDFLEKQANNADIARQKLPASGKPQVRKKRFENALVLVKTEKQVAEEEPMKPETSSDNEISDNAMEIGAGDDNDDDNLDYNPDNDNNDDNPDDENDDGNDDNNDDNNEDNPDDNNDDINGDVEEEIGSLAFDDPGGNSFMFDDNLPTGSLMIQGNDDDDEGNDEGNDDIPY